MILRPILTAFAAVLTFALPAMAEVKIQEVTSPGGIKAWLVEDHGIPFTALEIRFLGGTALDLPGKEGATYLMSGLIEEGAGDLDSRGFAEARDDLAASFRFNASNDTFAVSARFLSENRDQAVDLLADALQKPRFDQDAVNRVREQVLSGLRADARDPGAMASRAFDEMAFGSHPYAHPRQGSIKAVTLLTREDMVTAHQNALARDRIYVGAAGDISAEELGLILDQLFGPLPETGAPLPPEAEWLMTPGTTVIDYPGPQSVIYFGQKGMKQEDPDFFAAYILNEVLGGGRFSARLMTEVREKRGLTYGIGSYLVGMDKAEMLMGQFSASNDKVAEAISVIRDEWQKIARDGITEAELATTKTYLTGAYPLRFDGNAPIASVLVGMQLNDLPIDYIASRNDKVNAVTIEDVKRVAGELFTPDDLRFVITGRPDGVTATP